MAAKAVSQLLYPGSSVLKVPFPQENGAFREATKGT